HDLHQDVGNAHAGIDGAVSFRPTHSLAALLLEHTNLRTLTLAVDDGHHLRVRDEGRARENLSAVLFHEQHLLDRQLVARFAGGPVDHDEPARRDLRLTPAVLDDGVHIRHLYKGGSVPPKSFNGKGLGSYLSRTRVPLTF